MRSSAILVLFAATSIAAPAIAQSSAMANRNTLNDQAAYAERLQRQMLDGPIERTAPVDPDQNPRRARRAEAAAALINGGDCPGALALAEREGDRRLAARVSQVCNASAAAAPIDVERRQN